MNFVAPCEVCLTNANWKLVEYKGEADGAYKCIACEVLRQTNTTVPVNKMAAKCLSSPLLVDAYMSHRAGLYLNKK